MIKNILPQTTLTLSDFHYNLPPEQIAQTPVTPRDASRLLVMDRKSGALQHRIFRDILEYIRPQDVLVINDTRVIPARIVGRRAYKSTNAGLEKTDSTAPVELLLLRQTEKDVWQALAGPGKRAKIGDILDFGGGVLQATVEDIVEGGQRIVRLSCETATVYEALHQLGSMPSSPAALSSVRQEVVPTAITLPPAARRALIRSALSLETEIYSACMA